MNVEHRIFLLSLLSPFPLTEISITGEEFAKAVDIARKQSVEMLFYARLKKYYKGQQSFIDDYLNKTEKSYLWAVAQSMRQEAAEKKMIIALKNQGIPTCIIKGNEIARTLYEDPNCRSSADIDVLVREKDVVQADITLRNQRYVPSDEFPLAYLTYSHHHTTYYDSESKNHIELHWNVGVPYYFKLSSEELWQGTVTTNNNHTTLSLEMLMVVLLIHHQSHSFREFKILVDLLWAFHKYDKKINWNDLSALIQKLGLAKTTLLSMSQIQNLWPRNEENLQGMIALQHLLIEKHHNVPSFLVSYFSMDLDGNLAFSEFREKFYARLALDGVKTMVLSFLRTLFPPLNVVKDLYHNKCSLLLPIQYLRFIFGRFKKWTGFSIVYL